jgi:mRNA-degrading endonuclease RelE of RelBE toxin-antitoxin system
VKHTASSRFWNVYHTLPEDIRSLADKNFQLLKSNPRHPSLRLKRIGELWSARVGDHYRALGSDVQGGINWFWIGTHADYNKIIAP